MRSPRQPRKTIARHDFTDKSRGERLQKVLADAGVASRRESEDLIREGAVTVNDHVVDSLPAWVDPDNDRIEVHGRPLRKPEKHVYIVLFKPRGTVCTNSDPEGRPRAIDLVQHPQRPRLYCVGRLDLDASGLLLLTNDGEFANRLTHPRFGVQKGYDLVIDGSLGAEDIARIEREIFKAGRGSDMRSSLTLLKRDRDKTTVHLELCEHRNLQIKPLMMEVGHPVNKMRRTSFGPLKLKGLAVGEWRELTSRELSQLRESSKAPSAAPRMKAREPRRSMEEFAAQREERARVREAEAESAAPDRGESEVSRAPARGAGRTPAARNLGANPRSGERGGTRGDSRDGPRGDTRGGSRGDTRGGPRGDTRGGSREGFRAGPRSDVRGGAREASRGGPRGDARGGPRDGFRSGTRADTRGGPREGSRTGPRAAPRDGFRAGAPTGGRDRGPRAPRADARQGFDARRTESRGAGRPDARSANRDGGPSRGPSRDNPRASSRGSSRGSTRGAAPKGQPRDDRRGARGASRTGRDGRGGPRGRR